MGEITGVYCMSHAPGITGFPERADPGRLSRIEAAFALVAAELERTSPDAIVAISVEHFTNFFLDNLPVFAIGTARQFVGPASEQMAQFLRLPRRPYRGCPEVGRALYEYCLRHRVDPALVDGGLQFDENFCVPLAKADPRGEIPVVPIIVNGVSPPYPTLERCHEFGAVLREALLDRSIEGRVAVIGSGGLSHFVGMVESGTIDEPFDRGFLERLAHPESQRVTDYRDDELDRAGNGAHEVRAWIVAAAVAGVPFRTLAYEAEPAWLTGTAVARAELQGAGGGTGTAADPDRVAVR